MRSPFLSGRRSHPVWIEPYRAKLERYYRDLGYRDARVKATATVAAKGSDVALALDVSEGPLHLIGSVEITGVQSTRPSLVNNAVRLRPGQPAGAGAAEATERRLYDLGTFRRAELRFEPDPAPAAAETGTVSNKAIVAVEEPKRFQLRYGVELSSEYNSALDQRTTAMGFAADLRDRNFLGRGMSLGGGLRYEPDLTSARALFSVPPLSRHPIRTNVYGTDRSEQESDELFSVDDHERELSVEQRWRASRAIEVLVGLQRQLARLDADDLNRKRDTGSRGDPGVAERGSGRRSPRQLL